MLRRILVGVLLMLGVGGGLTWYLMSQHPIVAPMREALQGVDVRGDLDVDLTLRGLELIQGEEGRAQWKLTAKAAKYLQDSGTVKVDNPSVVYYLENREGNLTVAASQGLVLQDRKQARLWPDVQAEYLGNNITAGELFYNGTADKLTLSKGVFLEGAQFQINASRMHLNLKTWDVDMDNGVEAVLYFGGDVVDTSAQQTTGEPAQ